MKSQRRRPRILYTPQTRVWTPIDLDLGLVFDPLLQFLGMGSLGMGSYERWGIHEAGGGEILSPRRGLGYWSLLLPSLQPVGDNVNAFRMTGLGQLALPFES